MNWVRKHAEFHLHNPTDDAITVEALRKTCGCVEVDISSRVIEAQDAVTVTATTEPGGMSEPTQRASSFICREFLIPCG